MTFRLILLVLCSVVWLASHGVAEAQSQYCLGLTGKHRRLWNKGRMKKALALQVANMRVCRDSQFVMAAARWSGKLGQWDRAVYLWSYVVKHAHPPYMRDVYRGSLLRARRMYKAKARAKLALRKTNLRCKKGRRCKGGFVFIRKPLDVRLPFGYRLTTLSSSGYGLLNDTILVIREALRRSGGKLLIIGHTDSSGSLRYNRKLSRLRALHVLKIVRKKTGLPGSRFRAKGMAYLRPFACQKRSFRRCNQTDYQRQLNRRVEFRLLD